MKQSTISGIICLLVILCSSCATHEANVKYLVASPQSVELGDEAEIAWSVQNPDGFFVRINNQAVPDSGSMMVKPNETVRYILKVYDSGGVEQILSDMRVNTTVTIEVRTPKQDSSIVDETNINLVPFMPRGLTITKLDQNINSPCDDLCPIVTADGESMYFTRYQNHGKCTNINEPSAQHIWCSVSKSANDWEAAVELGFPLNNSGNNAVVSVSPDKNFLLLLNQYSPDGSPKGGGVSYTTKRKGGGWNIPQDVRIQNYYNNDKFAEYFMSADRQMILMAIQRNDSHGGRDLYMSRRILDSIYTEPMNLGGVVNTVTDEDAPFLSTDGKTLYFSSDGHRGYGKHDIFVTRRLDDTWLNWTKPLNLGSDINSSSWESYFTITGQGDDVYMVKDGDIVHLQMPDINEIRPLPLALVEGRVKNLAGENILARIVYRNRKDTAEWGYAIVDPDDGSFQIAFPNGDKYDFYAEAEDGLIPVVREFDASNLKKFVRKVSDLEAIELPPVGNDSVFKPERLTFDAEDDLLKPEAAIEIERVYRYMKANPKMNIEIVGYTDNRGSPNLNKKLSLKRAQAVANRIIAKGIRKKSVSIFGFGDHNPRGDNDTIEGRQMNRRVEFLFRGSAVENP